MFIGLKVARDAMKIRRRERERFQEGLIRWFKVHGRSFPWRETDDPFKISVAEILLQKTSAGKVRPIYETMIKRYPSPPKMANSNLRELKNLIKPLGLSKRAKMIKELSVELLKRYGGRVPSDKTELLKLPGVGEYTANAVLCFAYSKEAPLVDVNVARVLRRVFSLKKRGAPHADKALWEFARTLIPRGRAREFNLALLDLASKVCGPRNPKCNECPISKYCEFKANKLSKSNRRLTGQKGKNIGAENFS
jgi:A/G-specific adenine glycosylase